MAKFRDKRGRTYKIELTDGVLAKVRRILGVDLRVREDVANLADDLEGHVNLIYLCCQRQADEFGISDAEFGENLWDAKGEIFDNATTALLKSLRKVAKRRR